VSFEPVQEELRREMKRRKGKGGKERSKSGYMIPAGF
jgi:hypothetical protein